MKAALAVQGLKANDVLNVADVDTYNNDDDDDDQPTQRQNQPSQRDCYPNPSSHKISLLHLLIKSILNPGIILQMDLGLPI